MHTAVLPWGTLGCLGLGRSSPCQIKELRLQGPLLTPLSQLGWGFSMNWPWFSLSRPFHPRSPHLGCWPWWAE
jgi:hypothetical protein